ncbi:MAG: hypothetical protein K2Q10_05870 [Rhodospirillales bacterium]|nr:hypothetical protein [Rhodospirillales bacterium]
MEFEEYPLLNTPELMLTLLRKAAAGDASLPDCLKRLRHDLARAHEHPPVSRSEILSHLEQAMHRLVVAGLLEPAPNGIFGITRRGRRVLDAHPDGIDDTVLVRFPEYRRYLRQWGNHVPEDSGEQAYDEGWAAFRDGKALTDNPHRPDTAPHQAWQNGWSEAGDQESPSSVSTGTA